jgi:hypothetical protein
MSADNVMVLGYTTPYAAARLLAGDFDDGYLTLTVYAKPRKSYTVAVQLSAADVLSSGKVSEPKREPFPSLRSMTTNLLEQHWNQLERKRS